jgi:hypothetical protein
MGFGVMGVQAGSPICRIGRKLIRDVCVSCVADLLFPLSHFLTVPSSLSLRLVRSISYAYSRCHNYLQSCHFVVHYTFVCPYSHLIRKQGEGSSLSLIGMSPALLGPLEPLLVAFTVSFRAWIVFFIAIETLFDGSLTLCYMWK